MTYSPPTIRELASVWTLNGGVNLGIVGDLAHIARGVSYHLGEDRLIPGAYSNQTARDRAGLTNAASALDLGHADKTKLRKFSVWFVARCRMNEAGTRDVREVIYSPDGVKVLRWDRERGYASTPRTGEADDSHLTHTHISFYRDSETRSKTALFLPYFVTPPDTSTGGVIVNSYPVPKVPSVGTVTKGAVLYPTDAMVATDPNRIIIDPAREMPYLGAPSTTVRIVEYVDSKGVHTGRSYFVKPADLASIHAVTAAPTDCTAAVAAAVAPLKVQVADLTDQLGKASADLLAAQHAAATAAEDEQERIALAEAARIRAL
jgi:hypothetical protein